MVYLTPVPLKDVSQLEEGNSSKLFDPEREAANVRRANVKAAKNLRLFIVANVLSRMWTLTYADAHWERGKVIADVNDWLQRLRTELGVSFPAAYVLELHPGGHGWHVHVAMPSRYIEWRKMGRLWGHGHVQFSDGNRWIKKAGGKREQSRRLAAYLAKYMAKSWADHHAPGDHRYEVTQGFKVQKERRVFRTFEEARAWLESCEVSPLLTAWSSDRVEDWHGPPAWVFVWL